jgi:aldose 1-epimerase
MPSPEAVAIACGPLRARFVPAWGGRMTHLEHAELGDILQPTTDQVFDPWNWPRAGAYPLFPYHNRLPGAAFRHRGKTYRLRPHPALAGDAMHGPAHRRAWRIEDADAHSLTLVLAYPADDDWPFSFEARQRFSLDHNGLMIALALTNTAPVPAPAAIGWHPYLAAYPANPAGTDAQLAYPLDALFLPNGEPAFRRGSQAVPSEPGYTVHFTDWTRAWLNRAGSTITLAADPVLAHLAVHRMQRYLCFEPVSAAAGALALPEQRRGVSGLAGLAPGATLSGHIRLTIDPARGETTS